MSTSITHLIEVEGLPPDYREIVDRYWRPLSEDIAERYLDGAGGKRCAGPQSRNYKIRSYDLGYIFLYAQFVGKA